MHVLEISSNSQNAEISPVTLVKRVFHPSKFRKLSKHSQETFVVESVVSVWLQVNRLDKPNCLKGTLLKDTLEAFDDYKNKQQKCM